LFPAPSSLALWWWLFSAFWPSRTNIN
jgi:hypothetical protein